MSKLTYPIAGLIPANLPNSPLKNGHFSATKPTQGGADDLNRYICLQCDCEFTATQNAKYCSAKCRQKAYRKRHSQTTIRSCSNCLKDFYPSHASQVYCSSACNNAAYRRRRAGIVLVFASIAGIDQLTADDILERTGIKPARRVVEAAGYRWNVTGWELMR